MAEAMTGGMSTNGSSFTGSQCTSCATAGSLSSGHQGTSIPIRPNSSTLPKLSSEHSTYSKKRHNVQKLFQQGAAYSRDYVAAGIAAASNVLVTYPLFKTIVRIQMDGISLREAFRGVVNEGGYYLYRGVLPPLLSRTAQVSLMFGLYGSFKSIFDQTGTLFGDLCHSSGIPLSIWAGTCTGISEAVLLTPFEYIQTILSSPMYHGVYKNSMHVVRSMPLRSLWAGFNVVAFRNSLSTSLFFPCKAKLREISSKSTLPVTAADFIYGAGLGACLSSILFPLHVLKLQIQLHGGQRNPYMPMGSNTWNAWKTLIQERGIVGLYRGISLHFVRAAISWGIINALYEYFRRDIENYEAQTSACSLLNRTSDAHINTKSNHVPDAMFTASSVDVQTSSTSRDMCSRSRVWGTQQDR